MINELVQQLNGIIDDAITQRTAKRLLGEFRVQDWVYVPHLKVKGRIIGPAGPDCADLKMQNGDHVLLRLHTPVKELIRVRGQ